jgi:ABC-2 type transport system permease protein
MPSHLSPIIRKEFIQIVRDPRTLAVMFLIPIIQLVLLGYAATTNIEHLSTAVLDQDKTPDSRDLVDTYRASNYFDINYVVESERELRNLIDRGSARAGLLIPAGYASDLTRDHRAQIGFLIDGSDPSVATNALAAASLIGQSKSISLIQQVIPGLDPSRMPGLDVRTRVLYNPELASSNFLIPGIIAMILQFLTTFLTATSIVRERERGTIEQLIVTPLKPFELIIGKMIPYILIAFWDTLEVLLVGVVWFRVPMNGSVALLLVLCAVALLNSLGLGLFISTAARTQQEAMLLTYFTLLPMIFLSGFFFPLEAMPPLLQAVSYLVPLRYFLIVVRGIILKGIGAELLIPEITALSLFGIGILAIAAQRFRKRLE